MDSIYIKDYIKEKRPALSASSLATYASIIKKLYNNCFGEGKVDFSKFDDVNSVMTHLAEVPANKRKTILSALVVITSNETYRDKMMEDCKKNTAYIAGHPATEYSINQEQIRDIFDKVKKDAEFYMKKKTDLTMNELQIIQKYIILCILSGIYIAPRRLKDFTDFKIKNVGENDNYIDKKTLVFVSYKTAKTYGEQRIEMPKELVSILKKWVKINPTEYLLFNHKGEKLIYTNLTQRLNEILGKGLSVNALRHSFLKEKYTDYSKLDKELVKDMSNMGSSKANLDAYLC